MIYIPSKEELEELGFEDGCAITISNRATILYRELGGYYSLSFDDGGDRYCSDSIYPQSKEDIVTLIKMFTPPIFLNNNQLGKL